MSRIIKAAQLQVLVTSSQDIIFSPESQPDQTIPAQHSEGTILEATKLLDEAKAEAQKIVSEAKNNAEVITESAKASALQLTVDAESTVEKTMLQAKEQGWDAGYAEGAQSARTEVIEQTREMLAKLEEIIVTANEMRNRTLALQEHDFLKLSTILAEKLIKREISCDTQWLVLTIIEGLKKLSDAEKVTIRVCPSDYQVLREYEDFSTVFTGRISWQSDQNLNPGDCIFETEFGAIDASLERRLEKIEVELEAQIYSEE